MERGTPVIPPRREATRDSPPLLHFSLPLTLLYSPPPTLLPPARGALRARAGERGTTFACSTFACSSRRKRDHFRLLHFRLLEQAKEGEWSAGRKGGGPNHAVGYARGVGAAARRERLELVKEEDARRGGRPRARTRRARPPLTARCTCRGTRRVRLVRGEGRGVST